MKDSRNIVALVLIFAAACAGQATKPSTRPATEPASRNTDNMLRRLGAENATLRAEIKALQKQLDEMRVKLAVATKTDAIESAGGPIKIGMTRAEAEAAMEHHATQSWVSEETADYFVITWVEGHARPQAVFRNGKVVRVSY